MKKYTTALLLIAVLTIVIGGNVAFKTSPVVSAVDAQQPTTQDAMMRIELAAPEATSGQEMAKKSEYVLPYPGILQNHPLYFLKELRDKIIETLIVDPLRKSEFYLLQSDKWIAASTTLLTQNDIEKAQTVLNQSADRMELSVTQLKTIKDSGRQIPAGAIDKVDSAIEKHLEIVDELSVEKKINPDQARQTYLSAQEELMKLKD